MGKDAEIAALILRDIRLQFVGATQSCERRNLLNFGCKRLIETWNENRLTKFQLISTKS